ncbi:hypothetical protein [Leptothrix discophora]|uniref:Uncharacterized protein n=1 Tax=Leptothrix discophora TaxID=89 RepID=A0ABT9G0E3_LEPDI|nr:hypothetical protein [Leptothrix discophora]MDP4299950.1 hypothetical protein [Leptothrix discophora]
MSEDNQKQSAETTEVDETTPQVEHTEHEESVEAAQAEKPAAPEDSRKGMYWAVLVLWVTIPALAILIGKDWPTRGQIGDTFGVVNSLFSGFAFLAVFLSLRTQQEQLKLQREELRLQREEMAASRAELASQSLAQRALFRAQTAMIEVAAIEAAIEAHKLTAKGEPLFSNSVEEISKLSEALQEVGNRVRKENGEDELQVKKLITERKGFVPTSLSDVFESDPKTRADLIKSRTAIFPGIKKRTQPKE